MGVGLLKVSKVGDGSETDLYLSALYKVGYILMVYKASHERIC